MIIVVSLSLSNYLPVLFLYLSLSLLPYLFAILSVSEEKCLFHVGESPVSLSLSLKQEIAEITVAIANQKVVLNNFVWYV